MSWWLRSLRAVAWLALLAGAPVEAQAVRAAGARFEDARGAVVLLRGLNVAADAKVPPFRPLTDISSLDPLPLLGVNVARLLFTWEAFEPERGRYDESYFRYYTGLIDALHARGIWVIVDVHQDAFSRFTSAGCGDGMPAWAISAAVARDRPDNGAACATWGFQVLFDRDAHRSWDDFYAGVNGVRGRYLALLSLLAARLGGHPAVIGYDMLNEPWGDEPTQLAPLYADGARAIRANDPDALLFVSPEVLTGAGQDSELAKPSFGNVAYAPHYYDPWVLVFHRWWGSSPADALERMAQRARSWDAPLFVGEFGAPAGTVHGRAYLDALYAGLDRQLASGAQWAFVARWSEQHKDGWNREDFSIFDARRALRENYRVRPYAARIPGEPQVHTVGFEPSLSVELAWQHDPARGEARIFAPGALFSGAVRAETRGELACGFEPSGLYVRCSAERAGPKRVRLVPCGGGSGCLRVPASAERSPYLRAAAALPPNRSGGARPVIGSAIAAALLTLSASAFWIWRRRRARSAAHQLHG